MAQWTAVVVVPVLVAEVVVCGPPVVEIGGRAVPVPASTGAPRCASLGDTPVSPEGVVVQL